MVGIRYQGFFNVQGAGIFAFRLTADHFARLTIGKQAITEITAGPSPIKANWAGPFSSRGAILSLWTISILRETRDCSFT